MEDLVVIKSAVTLVNVHQDSPANLVKRVIYSMTNIYLIPSLNLLVLRLYPMLDNCHSNVLLKMQENPLTINGVMFKSLFNYPLTVTGAYTHRRTRDFGFFF